MDSLIITDFAVGSNATTTYCNFDFKNPSKFCYTFLGSFCEYRRTNDVKQETKDRKQFNSKIEANYNVLQTKEGQCAPVPEERPHFCVLTLNRPGFFWSCGTGGGGGGGGGFRPHLLTPRILNL